MSADQKFFEGSLALMQMAVACVMEKAGMTEVTVTREELQSIFDRKRVFWRAGVMVGFTCLLEDPAPTAEQIVDNAEQNHPEPEAPTAEPMRNWEEDFSHENGQYTCRCVECGHKFIGHKRRQECKDCAASRSATVKIIKDCPACGGSGEGKVLVGAGPDAYHETCDCPQCLGIGVVEQ
jgi:hypothetical protein